MQLIKTPSATHSPPVLGRIQQISEFKFLVNIIKYTIKMQSRASRGPPPPVSLSLLLCLCLLLWITSQLDYYSNFNTSKINDIASSDPISLPIILSTTSHRVNTLPIDNPTHLAHLPSVGEGVEQESYRLRRYELKDTKYKPEENDLSQLQSSILYNMDPPSSIFDVSRTITVEDYQLLQVKNLKIMLINPTDRFRFCINQIYADSEAVKRVEQRKLPFCLNPGNKYPFYFNLYVTEQKPILFRTSLYFIASIYDGKELVDEKIWPREIIAKISQNHLRILPVEAKNCGSVKNFTTLTIPNPHSHHIKVSFDNEYDPQEKNTQKQVMIPSQKNFKMSITSKQSIIAITTRASEGSMSDNRFPKLYLPVYCVRPLEINHFNIGVLNAERSIVEILVPVSSNTRENIQVRSIQVLSSTKTVELVRLGENDEKIAAGRQHVGLCRLIAHIPVEPTEKTIIEVKVLYFLESNPKQILQAKNTFKFYELRNPLSLEGRRFIDVTKLQEQDSIMNNIFPIRNNLNLPLLLVRVIFDQKIFKLTWLKDRREYIYPNQKRDEFALQYIGSRELKISPAKYIMMLQFNGNLFIPIELVIYDHSLQCVYNSVQQKCQNLGTIDYGYFRNNATKFKQLVIRNWNPVEKEIRIRLIQNVALTYGMNCTMSIFGPFPNYEIASVSTNNTLYFYLKGNHFIIINIAVTPFKNATSGQASFEIETENQKMTKKIKFKVENGTIALIPQILRISSIYEQTVEYLNLVSTFSQPYKIRATYVNYSNINIFFNNHSEIYENQWIGLALVYEPFQHLHTGAQQQQQGGGYVGSQVTPGAGAPGLRGEGNCCGNQYFVNTFLASLYNNEYKKLTYVSVRVVTTTQLQATSTIIIDNTPPKLIPEQNFTISLINYNRSPHPSSSSPTPSPSPPSNNNKQNKEFKIRLTNVFKQYLKYRPVLMPRALYEETKMYVATMKRVRRTYEDALFCVNNAIAVKHNFSPQMVKAMLALDNIPQQVTIEPLQNGQYYVGGSLKKNPLDSSTPELTSYVRKAVTDGARVCYKLNTTKYLKNLIESHILNDIAENYSTEIFHQFVEKQMENYNSFLHYLEYDQFYDGLEWNFEPYCRAGAGDRQFGFFRFCKQIGVTLGAGEVVVEPGEESEIAIKAVSKFKESSASFYLVLLNNITKSQVHFVQINITQPKLKITQLYGSSMKHITRKDLSKLLKQKQPQPSQVDPALKRYLSHSVPIFLRPIDSSAPQVQTFTISNPSTIDINITHIGFEREERACRYQGIQLAPELCEGFVIRSGQEKNISLSLSKEQGSFYGLKAIGLYLYHDDAFFFRFNIIVKGYEAEDETFKMAMYTFCLNLVSFIFMMMVIWRLKKEIDQKEEARKIGMKSKIMNPSNYAKLGARIEKKSRKLEPIPEDQILAVKQIQEKRLKQFFNSSGQSQIAKRHHTEQQQPSKIQILNVLKQDKNNMSVSEESSIDFIDLNALNKSTHNLEEEERSAEGEGLREGQGEEENNTGENEESNENDNENENENENEGEDWQKYDREDGRYSDADSNFTDGEDIDYANIKKDYGWGDPSQERKKQEESNSYYNVFYSQNPLKKKESAGLFHWMNDYQKPHHHR